jgi:hypothetical protein
VGDPIEKAPQWSVYEWVACFYDYQLEVTADYNRERQREEWEWDACIMGMSMPSDKTRMSGYTSAKRAMRAAEAWVLRQPEVRAQRALSNTRTTS